MKVTFFIIIMQTDWVFMRFVAMALPAWMHLKQISLSLGVQERSFYVVCLFTMFIFYFVFLEELNPWNIWPVVKEEILLFSVL